MDSKHLYEVIIVGAGTTGAAAAYHLSTHGVKNMLCLDMGTPGRGRIDRVGTVGPGTTLLGEDETSYSPQVSGTNVFPGGAEGPNTIKMIISLPPYGALEDFADQHSWDGVHAFLDLAARGRDLEVKLAREVLPNPSQQLRQLGSVMVCPQEDVPKLREEFDHLQRMHVACEWWDEAKVLAAQGKAAGFVAGIYFPRDAVIDSTAYAQSLLKLAVSRGALTLVPDCSPLASTTTRGEVGEVTLADGTVLRAKHVVLATGGMYIDNTLAGVLSPCYSYLSALPHREPGKDGGMSGGSSGNSPNFFTFGFSHDWCVTDGVIRVSGEDHYSGLKSPRAELRCGRLATWCHEKYPYIDSKAPYKTRYGIYAETSDHLPVIGSAQPESKVTYLVGCNAWGQAQLSAAAALTPALLGYKAMDAEEARSYQLFNIRRFSGKRVAATSGHVASRM